MNRSELQGTVLYDDSCGFCRRWVPFWEKTLNRRGFKIAPLQSSWVKERLNLPAEELEQELRLLFPDGKQVIGADVYRHVMRRIWWAFPFYLISIAPLFRRIFDWSYRTFADNRYRISSSCGLSPGGER